MKFWQDFTKLRGHHGNRDQRKWRQIHISTVLGKTTTVLIATTENVACGTTRFGEPLKCGIRWVGRARIGRAQLFALVPNRARSRHESSSYIQQLFTEVEVSSGGYLPSCFGKVNIHCYSPTLRRIIVLVYTTQAISNSQIVTYFLTKWVSHDIFSSGSPQEVNIIWYSEIEEPIKSR